MAAEFEKSGESGATVQSPAAVAANAARPKPNAAALGEAAMRRASVRRTWGRGPFKIADVYLFSQIAAATVRSLLMFAGLLIIAGALTAVKRLASGELSWLGMGQVLLFQLPRVFLFSLPMSTLFATVSTFSDLSGRGELIALGAGGWNLPRLLRAPLLWGAILAVLAFTVQEALVPAAETRKSEVILEQAMILVGESGPISLRDPARGPLRSVVQAARFDPKTNVLINPRIQFYKGLNIELTLKAKKGFWDRKTNRWKFVDGTILYFPEDSQSDVRTNTVEFRETWREDAPPPSRLTKAGMSLSEHLKNGDFEMVSITDLIDWRTQLEHEGKGIPTAYGRSRADLIRSATFGIHDKLATPLVCLFLILVGAPLGIRPQRSGSGGGVAIGISLIVIMAYYVIWTWASQLGKTGRFPPLPAAYLTVTIIFILGLVLVAKKNR